MKYDILKKQIDSILKKIFENQKKIQIFKNLTPVDVTQTQEGSQNCFLLKYKNIFNLDESKNKIVKAKRKKFKEISFYIIDKKNGDLSYHPKEFPKKKEKYFQVF